MTTYTVKYKVTNVPPDKTTVKFVTNLNNYAPHTDVDVSNGTAEFDLTFASTPFQGMSNGMPYIQQLSQGHEVGWFGEYTLPQVPVLRNVSISKETFDSVEEGGHVLVNTSWGQGDENPLIEVINPSISEDNEVQEGGSGGDPHIKPIFGTLYELPHLARNWRMIQGNNLTLNTSTRYFSQKEKENIVSYLLHKGYPKDRIDSLVVHGVIQNKAFVKSEETVLEYDFDRRELRSNKEIQHVVKRRKGGMSIVIELENEYHGKIKIELRHYDNPQVYSSVNARIERRSNECEGLYIRNYATEGFEVGRLEEVKRVEEYEIVEHKAVTQMRNIDKFVEDVFSMSE